MNFKRIELRQTGESRQWLPYIDGVLMDGVVSVEIENSKIGNYVVIRLVSSMVTWPQVGLEF